MSEFTMKKEEGNFNILMFPWLAHGHISPFLELAKILSKRTFNIYLCSTAVNLDSIKISLQKDSTVINLVPLKIPEMPQLPPLLHTTKNLPTHLLPVLFEAFQNSSSNFSDIINSLKPDLLIYDFFQPWAPKLALSQGIPCVYFATSGATTYAFFHHFHTNGISSTFPYPEIYLLDYEKVIRARILENIKPDGNDFASGNFKMSSDIVLVKSCKGIEGKYIDYLSILCNKKILPTGPLISNADDEEEEENSEIVQWLNGKNKYSTVYISFGSENFLSNEQIEEVAKGSKARKMSEKMKNDEEQELTQVTEQLTRLCIKYKHHKGT
ncbi:hypothetical protein ACJIZ3_018188 [Penstemon smallii]|uniref:Glycosyltransferase N-terminal domain-containing protein n=1 Tax=Penstemon smallii TaxID=265156 RepID=A0ABD3SXM4_9LAMI